MLQKTIKLILLILIISSGFLVAFAQDSYEIIKDNNDNTVIIKVITNAKSFAGAEFSFSIQNVNELKPVKASQTTSPFKFNDKLSGISTSLVEKNGKYYFGFASAQNIYDGEIYVGDLEFEYTGKDMNKIVFDNVLIGRVTEDKKTESEYIKYPVSEYVIKRTGGSSENPDNSGGNNNGKGDSPKEEASILKIGLDKETLTAYMKGYEDGTIRPENNMTRAEAATIFYRLLLPEVREKYHSTENTFTDVASDSWYNVYISTLTNAKILSGYEDNSFRPDKNLTRAEIVKILCQFEEINGDYETSFIDTKNHWAEKMINFAFESGWIKGYPDNTFRPDANITRAEVAAVINRYLGRTMTAPEFQQKVNQWKDITQDKWYYKDIINATNY